MIRRYIAWRNRNADDEKLRAISLRARVPDAGTSSSVAMPLRSPRAHCRPGVSPRRLLRRDSP
jgi:hypothetical protein